MPARFNHMELTLPEGQLQESREGIAKLYGDLLGWDAIDIPILGQLGLLLRTDPETSQFILVTEQKKHLHSLATTTWASSTTRARRWTPCSPRRSPCRPRNPPSRSRSTRTW